jgi:hypothetical protein
MIRLDRSTLMGIALSALVFTVPTFAQDPSPAAADAAPAGSTLGLAERRGIKKFQDEKYEGHLKAIRAAAGFDLELDVKWEVIAQPGQGESYSEDWYWTQIYFEPLAAALAQVGRDDMGKEALKKGLKKVVLTYDAQTAPATNYPNGVTFEGGVLTINFTPGTNAGDSTSPDFKGRVEAIIGALEPRL